MHRLITAIREALGELDSEARLARSEHEHGVAAGLDAAAAIVRERIDAVAATILADLHQRVDDASTAETSARDTLGEIAQPPRPARHLVDISAELASYAEGVR